MNDETIEARLEKLERVASDYHLAIARSEQIRRERRYALLQAAASCMAGRIALEDRDIRAAVAYAERLLDEIEKREKAESQR